MSDFTVSADIDTFMQAADAAAARATLGLGTCATVNAGAGVGTALGVDLGSAGSVLVTDYAADAGSTDAYVATLNPAPATLVVGAHYRFMANTANTGAATINFNGLGAKTIVKAAGGIATPLADNDIRAGQWVDVVYDGVNMQMQSTLGNASGGGGLANITETLLTASPNDTVNVVQLAASGGTTNVDICLTPKGSGAFIIGPPPDAGTTGGNKRGANAADFTYDRTSATQVASGMGALCGGRRATGSGTESIAWGFSCTAVGSQAIAMQAFTTASGDYAAALGLESQATAQNTFATGYGSKADRYSMSSHASGYFSATGDAQAVRFVLRTKTTTNAAVEMFLDGASTRLTIPAGKGLYGIVKIIGIKSDGSVAATYTRQVAIKNVSGTTALIGTVNTIGTDETGSTSLSITADDTNDALNISPTGITSEVWRWVATFEGVEIAYGS